LRFQKVRWADIPKEDRETFERFGEIAIQIVVSGTISSFTRKELIEIYDDPTSFKHAEEWLLEQADLRERRDNFITIAFAVLIVLSIATAVFDVVLALRLGK
jgi:hypothetical protein